MTYDLHRFVTAQDGIFEHALAELRAGAKRSHWMWFVFPQIAGLGTSTMARTYALGSLAEAGAYLVHPVLGERLHVVTQAVLGVPGSAAAILGAVDAVKLRSSMTLFARAAADVGVDPEPFRLTLDRFFGGEEDAATLALLEQGGRAATAGPG